MNTKKTSLWLTRIGFADLGLIAAASQFEATNPVLVENEEI